MTPHSPEMKRNGNAACLARLSRRKHHSSVPAAGEAKAETSAKSTPPRRIVSRFLAPARHEREELTSTCGRRWMELRRATVRGNDVKKDDAERSSLRTSDVDMINRSPVDLVVRWWLSERD